MIKKFIFLGLTALSLLAGPTLVLGQDAERGSVSGFIFQDTNGDGVCQDNTPLPGIAINFELPSFSSKIRVRSAVDGSYNVSSAGQGRWSISAESTSGRWVPASVNPIQLELSPSAGLVKENINFCMQRATAAAPNSSSSSSSSPLPPPVVVAEPTKTLPEQSKELLTTPPESIQPKEEELETIMKEPVDEKAVPVDQWLGYVNTFREMAGVPLVTEDEKLTQGAQSHARYMVVHDRPIAHAEDPSYPLYTPEGHIAGVNGVIFSTSQLQADHTWAINFWASAPFHLISMIDPNLKTVGFGSYVQDIGNFKMAGVLDVRSGLDQPDGSVDYPIMFPADGAETWILRHSLFEWPDPTHTCGFSRPIGPPIILLLGTGDITPRVSSYKVANNGNPVDVCMFNETNFSGSDSAQQSTGRVVLDLRDAVVLMPRQPLAADSSYSVEVQVNGETHAWSFTTRKKP